MDKTIQDAKELIKKYNINPTTGTMKENLDTLLSNAVKSGIIPGVVALVGNNKDLIYEGAFGERALGSGVHMTLDTVFQVASMTKTFTVIAAMQLVEQGLLDLDSPASYWLPELARIQVLEGFDENGQPILRDQKRSITLHHLLTHTSGFGYELFNHDLLKWQKATSAPDILSNKKQSIKVPLLFDAGERWCYGVGIDWAGLIVEAVSGLDLGSYFRKHIFNPLDITTACHKYTPEMKAKNTKLHIRNDDGSLFVYDGDQMAQDFDFCAGGHGIFTTPVEYMKVCQMLLNRGVGTNGVRILKQETVDLMTKNAIGNLKVEKQYKAMPVFTDDFELFEGTPKSWGLQFMINDETAPTGRSAGSIGWVGMLNTFFWVDYKKNITGVYMTQISPIPDITSIPVYYAFEELVYDSLK